MRAPHVSLTQRMGRKIAAFRREESRFGFKRVIGADPNVYLNHADGFINSLEQIDQQVKPELDLSRRENNVEVSRILHADEAKGTFMRETEKGWFDEEGTAFSSRKRDDLKTGREEYDYTFTEKLEDGTRRFVSVEATSEQDKMVWQLFEVAPGGAIYECEGSGSGSDLKDYPQSDYWFFSGVGPRNSK